MPPKAWHVPPCIALRHRPQGPTGALALHALARQSASLQAGLVPWRT